MVGFRCYNKKQKHTSRIAELSFWRRDDADSVHVIFNQVYIWAQVSTADKYIFIIQSVVIFCLFIIFFFLCVKLLA